MLFDLILMIYTMSDHEKTKKMLVTSSLHNRESHTLVPGPHHLDEVVGA